MITFLMALTTLATGNVRRCGLEALPQGWMPSAPPSAQSAQPDRNAAARNLAVPVASLQTAHFVVWWTSGSIGIDTIHGAAPKAPLAGDSVPALVRAAATSLESAWHLYVDSLGYLPPKAAYLGAHWRKAPPKGKYPVEICQIDSAYFKASDASYFGLTIPYTDGSSSMLLASDLFDFGQWSYERDIDGGQQGTTYNVDWAEVIRATSAHEEFHAVQFNYETNLGHFLFESSAVAMEKTAVPTESDYLAFADARANGICNLTHLTPLLSASSATAYPHAWYVQQLVDDYDRALLRKLWENRAVFSGPIRNTLTTVLGKYNTTFDTTLGRYATRLGLSGRRNGWLLPSLARFSDGALFPTLSGTLSKSSAPRKVTLDSGAIQEWIDTLGNTSDRIVDWIPDGGAGMGHAWKNGTATRSEWLRGSVRQSASLTRQDVWSLFNPGPRPALVATATSGSSGSWLWTSAAPTRTTTRSGQILAWTDPGGGATLSGIAAADTTCTPILHTDIWTPAKSGDPFAYSVAGSVGGHAFVLEDADRLLTLKNAVLTVPFGAMGTVWAGRGDGVWKKVPSSPSGSATAILLDSLDLALPLRILAATGTSPNLPKALVRSPVPNPVRSGSSIVFPLPGPAEGAQLEIIAANGTAIRRLEVPSGKTSAIWDVRNGSGTRVRPGVYWYLWRGVTGAVRGELLIAD